MEWFVTQDLTFFLFHFFAICHLTFFLFVFLLMWFHSSLFCSVVASSSRWSAIRIVRMHWDIGSNVERKNHGVSGIIKASVYRWNYALSHQKWKHNRGVALLFVCRFWHVQTPSHWNIILFVKCFTWKACSFAGLQWTTTFCCMYVSWENFL